MDALKQSINETLEHLGEKDFKKLQWHLQQSLLEGQKPIAKALLEKADMMETTDLIVSRYPGVARQIMVVVLNKIGRIELVEMFQGADPPLSRHRPKETDTLPTRGAGGAEDPAKHFVDRKRRVLVEKVTCVKNIVDLLFEEGAIKQEGYDNVLAPATNPDRMRELYKYLNSKIAKDIFYKCLEEYEKNLLQELKPSSDEVDHSNRDRTSKEYSGTHNELKKQPGTLEDKAKSGGAAASGSWLDTGAEQQDEPYVMENDPRGYCLILETVLTREGTEHDSSRLQQVFSWLGFKVMRCQNKTAADMGKVLKFFAEWNWQKLLELEVKQWSGTEFTNLEEQLPQHGDCFVCCILSHGKEKGICGTDGKIISILDIISPFSGIKCKALLGKPKVFLIQACRGVGGQKQTDVLLDGGVETSVKLDYSLPEFADFLVAFSTINLYASARVPATGSWYIQALCDELEKGCTSGDNIDTILTRVNGVVCREVGKMKGVDFKQSPDSMRVLLKPLIFRSLYTKPI